MSKSDAFENSLLKLIFNATPMTGMADNAASSPVTNLYVSLHTADPAEAGNQGSNEISYTGYARQPVARTTGGFTVTGNSVSPVANVTFPTSTGGTGGTVLFFGVGTLISGAGVLLYSGAVSPSVAVTTGVQPVVSNTSTVTED